MSIPRHKPALSETARPILRLVSTGADQRAGTPIPASACSIVPALVNVFDIRPIQPADAELIVAAVAYTSSETYYRRFHAAKCRFSRMELDYLTQVDGTTHVALVAVERGEHPRLAADARFCTDPHLEQALFRLHSLLVSPSSERRCAPLRTKAPMSSPSL